MALKNFLKLAKILPAKQFNILVSGIQKDGKIMRNNCKELFELPHVSDITGKYHIDDFISLIEQVDALIAHSTGPLHIAAATGTTTIGLYGQVRPRHSGRWEPLGKHTCVLSKGQLSWDKKDIKLIETIQPEEVKNKLLEMLSMKMS